MTARTARTRWSVIGQLGPLFDDGGPMLLVEARSAFGRRPMHRAKAQLLLSALRHRGRELGDRVEYVRAETFAEGLAGRDDLEVIDPPTRGGRRLARRLGMSVLPSRGFVTEEEDFREWALAKSGKRLLLEDFYRWSRERTGVLMRGDQPEGGRWNYDHDNRNPPPKGASRLGLPDPWWPEEDDIDEEVRADLARWEREGAIRLVGEDGPRRFAATPAEAEAALADFVSSRLGDFGTYEDAMLSGDWTMAHSLLSAPLNLGLLDPRAVIDAAAAEHASGGAPLASVEGFVRQILGWRDYVWHLYWHLGPDYRERSNALGAKASLPQQLLDLDPAGIEANCLHETLDDVRHHGWAHHIQRLMVLGNWGLQRGWDPAELNDWFVDVFVDGTEWVMPANVIGMSQHADGGVVATKPYSSGGAYINKMSDYCGGCRFNPKVRLGENACPVTAGYWAFLDRTEPVLRGNHRMAQPLAGLRALSDRAAVVDQERHRESY
ncbi:cryptochrome/photolyase family protein [Rathayibacter sp. VKM Ac-2926]|uniref:cryptochrome/photolyase family protein n=1 Tax=Rathayibacter sp. VKM Ac-2926 TaxID=2929477 RepID=UPI001FB47A1F|nr:cryptochrome/photolyase family protein [Rathayibacter sp. VKM Ac-2926]MCJ1702353.1 cryptochrome/photolyase family protein [Rathayibacter sp. VKM Ac-2926]